MEGLGISTPSTSTSKPVKRDAKRLNGDMMRHKGKQPLEPPTTYTVSKIDAGQAVLISDQIHCIEFPSILLPPGCTTGSVISIACSRNIKEEQKRADEFWDLQDDILSAFGERSPAPPRLRLRNVTQTSVTLEWDKLDLATSKLLGLTIWRNGQRLAAIPNPLNNTSTKVSGLDVDANYTFHLIMRTTAGTYASQTIKTRTLTLTDTSGIAVCFGAIDPPELVAEAKEALTQMHARWSNRIQIETTHFVCTHASGPPPPMTPTSDSPQDVPDPNQEFQRASQLSIPIVQPSWITACLREKKMVPISAHYVDKAAIGGGPSSTVSLSKNSTKSQQNQPQKPRDAPRASIQLQKPPAPKNASPDVSSDKPLPTEEGDAQSARSDVPKQAESAAEPVSTEAVPTKQSVDLNAAVASADTATAVEHLQGDASDSVQVSAVEDRQEEAVEESQPDAADAFNIGNVYIPPTAINDGNENLAEEAVSEAGDTEQPAGEAEDVRSEMLEEQPSTVTLDMPDLSGLRIQPTSFDEEELPLEEEAIETAAEEDEEVKAPNLEAMQDIASAEQDAKPAALTSEVAEAGEVATESEVAKSEDEAETEVATTAREDLPGSPEVKAEAKDDSMEEVKL